MSDVKVNVLINISSTHMTAMKDRMNLEWKVIFTSISLFLSIIVLDFKNPIYVSEWILWSGSIAISLLASGYLLSLHHSDLIDKTLYIHAESELIQVAKDPNYSVKDQPDIPSLIKVFSDREGIAWLWQAITVLAFSLICAYVVATFSN